MSEEAHSTFHRSDNSFRCTVHHCVFPSGRASRMLRIWRFGFMAQGQEIREGEECPRAWAYRIPRDVPPMLGSSWVVGSGPCALEQVSGWEGLPPMPWFHRRTNAGSYDGLVVEAPINNYEPCRARYLFSDRDGVEWYLVNGLRCDGDDVERFLVSSPVGAVQSSEEARSPFQSSGDLLR